MHGSLATRLRVLRAERGLTVRQVAELSGVAKETISQVERGERHPYDRTLAKLAHAYDVPVEGLLEEPALVGKAEAPPPGPADAKGPDPEVWGRDEDRPKPPSMPGTAGKHIHVEIGGGEVKVTERSFLEIFRDIREGRIASEEEALQRLRREDRERNAS